MFGFGKKKEAKKPAAPGSGLSSDEQKAIDAFLADKVKNLKGVAGNCEKEGLFSQPRLVKLQRTYHLNSETEVKAMVAGAFLRLHGHFSRGVPEGENEKEVFDRGLAGRATVFQEMTDLRSIVDAFGLTQLRAHEVLKIVKNEAKAKEIVNSFGA